MPKELLDIIDRVSRATNTPAGVIFTYLEQGLISLLLKNYPDVGKMLSLSIDRNTGDLVIEEIFTGEPWHLTEDQRKEMEADFRNHRPELFPDEEDSTEPKPG